MSCTKFQSTLPHGSDPCARSFGVCSFLFQSTLPHGSDIHSRIIAQVKKNFNPRSLTGATLTFNGRSMLRNHFNPRSLTGATKPPSISDKTFFISIHAPSRERPIIDTKRLEAKEFQSTLPHGSDF